jgi:hypothetical protein
MVGSEESKKGDQENTGDMDYYLEFSSCFDPALELI